MIICGQLSAQVSKEYKASVEQWHQNRIADLKQENDWLNLE